MPSGKKRKRHKMATHKRKKRLRKNRHKKKKIVWHFCSSLKKKFMIKPKVLRYFRFNPFNN